MEETLDQAPCGFLTFTDDGIIRRVNTTLHDLLGYGPGEMEGQPFAAILSAGSRVFYQTHLFPTLKMHGKAEEIYLSLRTRSEEEVPVLLNGARRETSAAARNECVLVTMRQRSRFEDELLRAKKAAEEATRAKDTAYAALAKAHEKLEAQQSELQIHQRQLLELHARERRIADVLQNALRPEITDTVPGLAMDAYYQPAWDEAEVGGDFYDVFSLKKDCYALVVADLSGKGLAAASQVATVRHMLRALMYRQDLSVAQAVTSLNDMLAGHNLLEGFATLFVGAYDRKKRTLTYVNAGQEPGLIRREVTGDVEELGPTGPVLGGFTGAVFVEKVAALSERDVLALFTDGLTEAGSNRKELLEIEGVTSIFKEAVEWAPKGASPGEIIAQVMARVEAMVTSAGIRDDVCLFVARADEETS